jgi:NADPH-dependent ferric siderophore reductase
VNDAVRVRRAPPPFRPVTVLASEPRSHRLVRVTLGGPELEGFAVDEPAASVRLLLPPTGQDEPPAPTWNGNEWLLPDGSRPTIRTLTPLHADPAAGRLDVEVVLHDGGAASAWAAAATPGQAAALSGPGRGYTIDRAATAYLLAGDETALPAVGQLLGELPDGVAVEVHVEVAGPEARLPLPDHPLLTEHWHDAISGEPPGTALVAAVRGATVPDGAHVWAAGEAAAVQRIRRHLFDDRALPRSHAHVRGYWKHGRTADTSTTGT